VILKLAGELYHYEQNHTPFDVVGWHGKYVLLSPSYDVMTILMVGPSYVPYKYAMEKLLSLTSSKDQLDPSAYTVLTAKSKVTGVSLTDFCVFAPKWVHSLNSFRPPVRPSLAKLLAT
jgi:homogentisate 1,2-dioxygenase